MISRRETCGLLCTRVVISPLRPYRFAREISMEALFWLFPRCC
jgi:hypothetical protein